MQVTGYFLRNFTSRPYFATNKAMLGFPSHAFFRRENKKEKKEPKKRNRERYKISLSIARTRA